MTSDAERIARLQRENAALDEQIKLLVQTEQRLYRSQNALDRELSRSRALARLALRQSSFDEAEEILARATRLLRTSFHLDDVVALLADPDTGSFRSAPGEEGLAIDAADPALQRWRTSALGPSAGGAELLPPGVPAPDDRADVVASIALPLHVEGRLFALLLGWSTQTPAGYSQRELPSAGHVPFLELVAGYLERALENTVLTRNLAHQRRQLARSNARLTASLAELERAQHQLLQAGKMEAIGRLAGGIAHDFNNLLTVIINHAELLRTELADGSPAHRDVERITEASDRAVAITRQLLAFSRREPWHPEPLDLNDLVRSVVGMLERVIGDRVELDVRLGAVEPVNADRSQIEQVLLNLAVNARDAMSEEGVVRIETRPATAADLGLVREAGDPAGFAVLAVRDSGAGMDESTRAQVFEPFFTTKGPGQGTGLGLSVAYGAVRRNHGFIGVESHPGRGSCFTVLLPRAGRAAEPAAASAAAEPGEPPRIVLLVVDDPEERAVAAEPLGRAGYLVLEAEGGDEGLALAAGAGPPVDILVTDMVLPRRSGLELARALRDESPGLPVVFLSGYPFDNPEAGELARLGVFLQKPFTGESLVAAVETALTSTPRVAP